MPDAPQQQLHGHRHNEHHHQDERDAIAHPPNPDQPNDPNPAQPNGGNPDQPNQQNPDQPNDLNPDQPNDPHPDQPINQNPNDLNQDQQNQLQNEEANGQPPPKKKKITRSRPRDTTTWKRTQLKLSSWHKPLKKVPKHWQFCPCGYVTCNKNALKDVAKKFWAANQTHASQTAFLYAAMRAGTWGKHGGRHVSWEIQTEEGSIQLCSNAMIITFELSRSRLRGVKKQYLNGDKRGSWLRTNTKYTAIRAEIKAHTKTFPMHKNHYKQEHCPHKYYIDRPGLKKAADMWRLYQSAHSDKPELCCSIAFYWSVFKDLNIGFVRGRSDDCSICRAALAQNKTNTAKHKRHEYQYRLAQKHHKIDIDTADDRTFVGERDLKSVTDLPRLPNGEMFYLRALG